MSKRLLTPYDKGERLEPKPWVDLDVLAEEQSERNDPDAYGKVDFDNDEGGTVATVWFEKNPDARGSYTMHVRGGAPLHFLMEVD